jgi:hypothetical protein
VTTRGALACLGIRPSVSVLWTGVKRGSSLPAALKILQTLMMNFSDARKRADVFSVNGNRGSERFYFGILTFKSFVVVSLADRHLLQYSFDSLKPFAVRHHRPLLEPSIVCQSHAVAGRKTWQAPRDDRIVLAATVTSHEIQWWTPLSRQCRPFLDVMDD